MEQITHAITAALGVGIFNAVIALAVSWFPWYARIVRGAVMRTNAELYVAAARAMGVGNLRIMLRHSLPNSLTPVIVQGSLDFGYAILAAASLSFIGIGAQPPTPEWGLMAALSRTHFIDNWWTVGFPGLAMFVTVLAVTSLLGAVLVKNDRAARLAFGAQRGLARVLDWLEQQPGDSWQDRWLASGADAEGNIAWRRSPADGLATTGPGRTNGEHGRLALARGLSLLVVGDVIRPGLGWLMTPSTPRDLVTEIARFVRKS